MTAAIAASVSKVVPSSLPPDDPVFDFNISDWVVPSLLVSRKDESSAQLKSRQQNEHVYRSKTTPTLWNRYLALGRYSMSGSDFDALMNASTNNYAFHVDRNMECSPKLAAWAVQRSKPYLTKHQTKALLVDTVSVSWKQYEAEQEALLDNESQVNVQLVDLTDVHDTDDTQLTTSNTSSDETLFDFTVENWIEPPVYVTNLPETNPRF
jgi:hypothetical protein